MRLQVSTGGSGLTCERSQIHPGPPVSKRKGEWWKNKQMANGNQRRKGAFGLGLPEGVVHAEGLTIGLPDLCHAVGGKLHIGGVGGLKDRHKAAT